MELEEITQYIISIAPSVAAILTTVIGLITAILKIRTAIKEVTAESTKNNNMIQQEMAAVLRENRELKRDIKMCMNKINKIDEVK